MPQSFLDRINAGAQSAEQTVTHEGDVTVTYTEDTSAPYPHYMHQPVTDSGSVATYDDYDTMTSAITTDEAQALAGQMLDSIDSVND